MQIRGLDFSGTLFPNFSIVPKDVRLLTAARATRWAGWGFAESLLPIFILSFSASLTEAGLVRAAYDVVFLAMLPLVGILADVIPSKTLLIVGLVIYPFIGFSYWLAGATGLVLFVVLARALNGVSYCLDSVGTDTYIRRTSSRHVAAAFGYAASIANFWWLAAALAGAYLVRFFPIHDLLFLVVPFSLIALIPLSRVARDTPEMLKDPEPRTILRPLTRFLKEIVLLQRGLRGVVFLMFILDSAYVAAAFFIPIDAYQNGASLSAVAILAVISATPSILEFWLAEFIDGGAKKRRYALTIALALLPLLLLAAAFASTLTQRIVIALGVQTAVVFGILALQSYATVLSRRDRYGETSSVLEGATTLGDLTAPIALGILADALGIPVTFSVFAIILLFVAIYFLRRPIDRALHTV